VLRRSSRNGTPAPRQPPARTTRDVPGDEAITGLRAALRDANQKITTLNGRLDALATVTANIYRENQASAPHSTTAPNLHHYPAVPHHQAANVRLCCCEQGAWPTVADPA
jgi:hypothetical protein